MFLALPLLQIGLSWGLLYLALARPPLAGLDLTAILLVSLAWLLALSLNCRALRLCISQDSSIALIACFVSGPVWQFPGPGAGLLVTCLAAFLGGALP